MSVSTRWTLLIGMKRRQLLYGWLCSAAASSSGVDGCAPRWFRRDTRVAPNNTVLLDKGPVKHRKQNMTIATRWSQTLQYTRYVAAKPIDPSPRATAMPFSVVFR